jgi:hypothetical protein
LTKRPAVSRRADDDEGSQRELLSLSKVPSGELGRAGGDNIEQSKTPPIAYFQAQSSWSLVGRACLGLEEDRRSRSLQYMRQHTRTLTDSLALFTFFQVVHAEGCPIVLQSWHVGRIAHPEQREAELSGKPVYAPSAIAARGGKVRSLPLWFVDEPHLRHDSLLVP